MQKLDLCKQESSKEI